MTLNWFIYSFLYRNSELHRVLTFLDINKTEVDELINDADIDGDGRIEYEGIYGGIKGTLSVPPSSSYTDLRKNERYFHILI